MLPTELFRQHKDFLSNELGKNGSEYFRNCLTTGLRLAQILEETKAVEPSADQAQEIAQLLIYYGSSWSDFQIQPAIHDLWVFNKLIRERGCISNSSGNLLKKLEEFTPGEVEYELDLTKLDTVYLAKLVCEKYGVADQSDRVMRGMRFEASMVGPGIVWLMDSEDSMMSASRELHENWLAVKRKNRQDTSRFCPFDQLPHEIQQITRDNCFLDLGAALATLHYPPEIKTSW